MPGPLGLRSLGEGGAAIVDARLPSGRSRACSVSRGARGSAPLACRAAGSERPRASCREIWGETLVRLGEQEPRMVVLTADLGVACATEGFSVRFPDRFFDIGIAEQDMLGIASGLALCGLIPFTATFACFITMRGCEQVRTDIAYPNLNVKIMGCHSGVATGPLGTTHHSIEDLAIMRAIPNMTVLVPADAVETGKALEAAAGLEGPVYLRLGSRAPWPVLFSDDYTFQVGKAPLMRPGKDVTLAATGLLVSHALEAAELLAAEGIEARVLNFSSLKPIDEQAIAAAMSETRGFVTAEEHNRVGGLGSAIAEVTSSLGGAPVTRLGIPDRFCEIGTYEEILEDCGLVPRDIAAAAVDLLVSSQQSAVSNNSELRTQTGGRMDD